MYLIVRLNFIFCFSAPYVLRQETDKERRESDYASVPRQVKRLFKGDSEITGKFTCNMSSSNSFIDAVVFLASDRVGK